MKLLIQEILRTLVPDSAAHSLLTPPGGGAVRPTPGGAKASVVISAPDRTDSLPLVLAHLPMDSVAELILVDGPSADDMVAVATKLLPEIQITIDRKRGKGAAVKAGYAAATGEMLVVMDADGFDDPREIPGFLEALREGADRARGG